MYRLSGLLCLQRDTNVCMSALVQQPFLSKAVKLTSHDKGM